MSTNYANIFVFIFNEMIRVDIGQIPLCQDEKEKLEFLDHKIVENIFLTKILLNLNGYNASKHNVINYGIIS